MDYIDVLPLDEMKTYLRIDDGQVETDDEIQSMIGAALRWIEAQTNHLVVNRQEKEYIIDDGCVRVYDYPVNSVVKGVDDDGVDVTLTYKTNYNRKLGVNYIEYYDISTSAEKLILDVGYLNRVDVPLELIQVAKEIVKSMYFEQEETQTIDDALTVHGRIIIEQNRRFIV